MTSDRSDADLVVVAAGTFCSPAILLRSGIGPAAELVELGIPVKADLPGVGANLQEHPSVGCAVPIEPMDGPRYQVLVTWASRLVPAGWPFDMHLVPAFNSLPVPWSPTGAAGWVAVNLMKPKSHGRVWLRSADPATLPRVDAGLLTHPDDLACLVEGVVHARQLLRGGPLADLAAGAELLPGGDVADDEQAIGAFVQAKVFGCDHWVGTCAMGPAADTNAVVDSRGRVHGVDRLVVADASIMPEIPAANTNAPTVMLAERVAAWLTDQ